MLKKLLCIIAAVAVTLPASGCKNKDTASSEASVQPDTSASSEITAAPAEKPTESPYIGINPLTGEGGYNTDAYGKRPVAVMVNNLKDSLPQYGIEQADIIYELPVEGGITRLMAVYADYTNVPDICSVRSCRYYYPLLCLGMDAVYCHWGADQTIALDTLNRTGIDHIDGGYEKTLFYRDEERVGKYASEHTGYLKGSELPEKIAEKGFRTDIDELYSGTIFNFADESVEIVSTEMTAKKVDVRFSSAYYSTFTYSKKTGAYMKQHSGEKHIDGKTGKQLAFDNVFVLQSDIHTRENGYLMDVALSGGSGYYFSKGGGQEIKWVKKGENFPIEVFDTAGNELIVNAGESYIGIIDSKKTITIE